MENITSLMAVIRNFVKKKIARFLVYIYAFYFKVGQEDGRLCTTIVFSYTATLPRITK